MKFWLIYHDGNYFKGDINDPIWAGERYEIICFDTRDFNRHYENYYYTPLQSMEPVNLESRWNCLSNSDEFARAVYLGKAVSGDVIQFEVDLKESRFLFGSGTSGSADGANLYDVENRLCGYAWYDFNYTFEPDESLPNGIPKQFEHRASGGINNIEVTIDDSQLAHYYVISFRGTEDSLSASRKVQVSVDELENNNNTITITRNTTDIYGNRVGFINGGFSYDRQID